MDRHGAPAVRGAPEGGGGAGDGPPGALDRAERGLADGLRRPRFEPIALGRPLTWKYRGQVVPRNQRVTLELELLEILEEPGGLAALADGWLTVDGVRIYAARGLAMCVKEA